MAKGCRIIECIWVIRVADIQSTDKVDLTHLYHPVSPHYDDSGRDA